MVSQQTDKIESKNFSQAFEQMCNFIAVAKTGDPKETIKGLIQSCFVLLPDDRFDSIPQFIDAIDVLFGVRIPNHQVQTALDELIRSGGISQPSRTNFVLNPEVRNMVNAKAQESRKLEDKIKASWLEEVSIPNPEIPSNQLWKAFRKYTSYAFRRHGIQAALLLDPTIRSPGDYSDSLSSLLTSAVEDDVERDHRDGVALAIRNFFADMGTNPERSHYIAQLADGAFNFYSLEVDPAVANQLRSNLKELILFLDTNFLFGILDLHYNSQVAVSRDLLRAVKAHNFPFKLRYHEATQTEFKNTIIYYGDILKSREWSQSLSRAAGKSRNISGIERKYHEQNAQGVYFDPNEFLRPYEHVDELLRPQGILIFPPSQDRLQERSNIHIDYQEFLQKNHREDKSYETINHDATVLDTVLQLRSKAKSTLEAGALLISCDYFLYRYDWETARSQDRMACVLLPNIFWQILRPFIPSDQDFEKAFAETFALPEFRAIASGGSKAASKMLQILATYKDIPEETASNILCNDILLDQLKAVVSDDKKFKECVEAAIIEENRSLLEEKASLARQLEAIKASKEQVEKEFEQQKQTSAAESMKAQELIRTKEKEAKESAAFRNDAEAKAQDASAKLAEMETAKTAAEKAAKQEAEYRENAEKQALRTAKVASVIIALLVSLIFEIGVNSIGRWDWLLNHPNSYGLQGCLCLMAFFVIIGLWVRPWRKALWGTGILGLIFVILTILGGPTKTP